MKKYLALALVGSLVMGNASASQTLNALDTASPVLTNEDEQRIGEFEVGLQFFMTPGAMKLEVDSNMTVFGNAGTATSAPAVVGIQKSIVTKVPYKSDNRMYGFGVNLGWNGLQSKIGTSGILLGSIGGVASYFRHSIDDSKLERLILGVRASIAPLFRTGKNMKIGPYVAGVLGGAQTQVTSSSTSSNYLFSILTNFKQGTTGTFSNNVWNNVDTTAVGYATSATAAPSKVGEFSTNFDAWSFCYAGEVGVRFQMRNVGLQLGALFDNNEYKVPSFQDKSKSITIGRISGDLVTVNNFYASNSTTAETITGVKITEAVTFNSYTYKKEDSSVNTFLTASIVLDM